MNKRGFTLIEVMVACIILTLGIIGVVSLFMQSQRLMMASAKFETAQRVLNYFEMVHPIPPPDQVTGDPLDDETLNIDEEHAEDLCDELELDLTPKDRDNIATYRVKRKVDEIDDEEIERNGGIYTVRTTVTWGGGFRGEKPDREVVVKLWWKGSTSGSSK